MSWNSIAEESPEGKSKSSGQKSHSVPFRKIRTSSLNEQNFFPPSFVSILHLTFCFSASWYIKFWHSDSANSTIPFSFLFSILFLFVLWGWGQNLDMHKKNRKNSGHLAHFEQVMCECILWLLSQQFPCKVSTVNSPIKDLVKNFGKAYFSILCTTSIVMPCNAIIFYLKKQEAKHKYFNKNSNRFFFLAWQTVSHFATQFTVWTTLFLNL